jgi:hypothetical protein
VCFMRICDYKFAVYGFFAEHNWIVAQIIAWLAGFGLVLLAEDLNVIGAGFLGEPSRIFGWSGPDPVVWTAVAVLFGLGFCSVTWAAIVWILRNLKSPCPSEGM